MSDFGDRFEPAIGLLESDSVVAGIVAGDAMAKASPVSALYAGTVHPGHYLVLVGGATFRLDGEPEHPVSSGGAVYVPSMQVHGFRTTGQPFVALTLCQGDDLREKAVPA